MISPGQGATSVPPLSPITTNNNKVQRLRARKPAGAWTSGSVGSGSARTEEERKEKEVFYDGRVRAAANSRRREVLLLPQKPSRRAKQPVRLVIGPEM